MFWIIVLSTNYPQVKANLKMIVTKDRKRASGSDNEPRNTDGLDWKGLSRITNFNQFVWFPLMWRCLSICSSLTLRMAEKWSTLHGWSVKECVDKYLENARRWPFFGCRLFQAQVWDYYDTGVSVTNKSSVRLVWVCEAVSSGENLW